MTTLRIEHRISNFEGWRKAFDSDPINRKQSGVKRDRIYRPRDNSNFIIIDLDFDNLDQAQGAKTAPEKIFPKIDGSLIFDAQLRILDVIEITEL
jgi:hypothetical protein